MVGKGSCSQSVSQLNSNMQQGGKSSRYDQAWLFTRLLSTCAQPQLANHKQKLLLGPWSLNRLALGLLMPTISRKLRCYDTQPSPFPDNNTHPRMKFSSCKQQRPAIYLPFSIPGSAMRQRPGDKLCTLQLPLASPPPTLGLMISCKDSQPAGKTSINCVEAQSKQLVLDSVTHHCLKL